MQKRQEEGLSIKETFSKFEKFTVENHAKSGTNRLGKCALDAMRERRIEIQYKQRDKIDSTCNDWQEVLLILKNP